MTTRTLVPFAVALLAAGCVVGPNYKKPAPLGTNALPHSFAGVTDTNASVWKLAQPSAHLPRGSWWEEFGDSELNRIETLVTANNQELAVGFANFQQARALVNVARSGYFPQLSAGANFSRQRTTGNGPYHSPSTTFDTFSVPLDATWELDLWGRVRRTVEASRARMTAVQDDLQSLKLSIQAEVAVDYFTLRSQDAQHRLLEQTIANYKRALELTQNRFHSGIATDLDISQAETQLRAAEAQMPAVDLQRANLRHALATLCGQSATIFELSETGAAARIWQVPVSLPSQLLEHRPDIAAAERRMAAANADVGVADAAFYPSVTLNGLAGLQSVSAGTLFNWESRLWSVGPSLSLPLFTGGRNRARLASARAAYDATVASYRQTVLNAFQDVEDQLAAQTLLARQFDAENAALAAARRTLEISLRRYKGGIVSYLEVTSAQGVALAHEQTVVRLGGARLAATVSLIKALGAGWDQAQVGQLGNGTTSQESLSR